MPTLDYFHGPTPPRHDNRLQWGCLLPGVGMMAFGALASIIFHRADQYVVDPGGGMCLFALGFICTVFVTGVVLLNRAAHDRRDEIDEENEDETPEGFSRR